MSTATVSPIVSDRELLMAVAQGKMPLDKALELMSSMKQAIRADAAAQAAKPASTVAPVEFSPADRAGWVICYHSRRPNGYNSLFPTTLPLDVWERIFAAADTFKAFADAHGKDLHEALEKDREDRRAQRKTGR
jgi:hypothetical protein